MYDYSGLLKKLEDKQLKKSHLVPLLHISPRTISKISKGESISHSVIKKLCNFFQCNESDLVTKIPDNPLLERLLEEMTFKIKGGIYHEIQVRMTYNSNHIEGSTLTEDQTRRIFETQTIDVPSGTPLDDIIETSNHFRAIDYCIERAKEPLTATWMKQVHYLLKRGTQQESLDWFQVG